MARPDMTIELWWGSGSPYSWRALLALEYKQLPYVSHLVEFAKQEHKSPQLLAMNPRGRVPVLKDGDYVCYESLAIMTYLDRKYPEAPLFGTTPAEAATIMRFICEYQGYVEDHIMKIIYAILFQSMEENLDAVTHAMHIVSNEARSLQNRLAQSAWLVGEQFSAADVVIFPGIQMLMRALSRPEAQELRDQLLPLALTYPAIAAWIGRVEALPNYAKTYPPHWKE
jgi:glutathione S-transferase